jgi:hypothetical protein
VTNCGRICIFKKKINLSTSLAGQEVGIKQVDQRICLVSFMDYDLGYIDLEEKTLQPLDNPFGPRVSSERSVKDLSGPYSLIMAERVGFEPTVEFPQHSLSRRAPSTTRTPLRVLG